MLKRPPVGMVWQFWEEVSAQVVSSLLDYGLKSELTAEVSSSSLDHGSKLQGPSPRPLVLLYKLSLTPRGYGKGSVAAVAEWYRYRIMACLVTSSSPVPPKTRPVNNEFPELSTVRKKMDQDGIQRICLRQIENLHTKLAAGAHQPVSSKFNHRIPGVALIQAQYLRLNSLPSSVLDFVWSSLRK
ncbi:hypothetical protein TNCV_687001 [Trichonephila clavipes]|nr:hypothetical protein TNCV_687001 [Trichonephila clavipes]